MANNYSVDSRKFMQAMTGLQKAIGRPLKDITRAEAGSILKQCAGWTKVSSNKDTERRARARALHSITTNGKASPNFGYLTINSGVRSGQAGDMWYRTRNKKFQQAGVMNLRGGGFTWSNIHFPNVDWPQMQAAAQRATSALSAMIPSALKATNLARQSWVQIGDSVGIDVGTVPGGGISAAGANKARAAIASDGRAYRNGQARQYESANGFVIWLTNALPYCRRINLDGTLIRAMNGRSNYYAQNLKRGVFNKFKEIARAYPGIKIDSN